MIKIITGIITICVTGIALVISVFNPAESLPETDHGLNEFRHLLVEQANATSNRVADWNDRLRTFDIHNDYKYYQLTNTLRSELTQQQKAFKTLFLDWQDSTNWPDDSVQVVNNLRILQTEHKTLARRIEMVTHYE